MSNLSLKGTCYRNDVQTKEKKCQILEEMLFVLIIVYDEKWPITSKEPSVYLWSIFQKL